MTDNGIVALCGGVTEEGKKRLQGNIGQCKSIRKLMIDCTEITQSGVQVALRNLPDLETLQSEFLGQALAEMHRTQRPFSKYVLTALLFGSPFLYPPFRNGYLRLAAPICPLVTKVVLNIYGGDPITNEELLALIELEKLRELDMKIFYDLSTDSRSNLRFTFNGGIVPVLKAHGSSLRTVKFRGNAFEVDLFLLMESCPNLRNMHLDCGFTSMRGEEPTMWKRVKSDQHVLNRLEKLYILDTIASDNLIFLLSAAPALTDLSIFSCPSLTDEILQHIHEFNLLPCLRKLWLTSCDSVSKEGIDLFMNEENILEEIHLFFCQSITQKNVKEWQEKAKKNNWKLSIIS